MTADKAKQLVYSMEREEYTAQYAVKLPETPRGEVKEESIGMGCCEEFNERVGQDKAECVPSHLFNGS